MTSGQWTIGALRNVSVWWPVSKVSPSLTRWKAFCGATPPRNCCSMARMRSLQTMTVSGWRSSTSLTVPEWSGSMWWMTR